MKFFTLIFVLLSLTVAHAETPCQQSIQGLVAEQAELDFPGRNLYVIAPDTTEQEGGAYWMMYDVNVIDQVDGRVVHQYRVAVDEVCGLTLQPN